MVNILQQTVCKMKLVQVGIFIRRLAILIQTLQRTVAELFCPNTHRQPNELLFFFSFLMYHQ